MKIPLFGSLLPPPAPNSAVLAETFRRLSGECKSMGDGFTAEIRACQAGALSVDARVAVSRAHIEECGARQQGMLTSLFAGIHQAVSLHRRPPTAADIRQVSDRTQQAVTRRQEARRAANAVALDLAVATSGGRTR